ncbi:MAG: alpha/beta hydrolase [Clostridiales bacterium]|nr:alpha/beta hydrolase [Clostridiales bacterium]
MLSRYYKIYSKDFKVYIFSRKRGLKKGYTTKDMARDQKTAMDQLGIEKANVIGISQGGMIAQHLAIYYPQAVIKLVLAVTASKQYPVLQSALKSWIQMAKDNDYGTLMMDTMEKTYTEKKIKSLKLLSPIIKRVGKPKSFDSFIIQANAGLTHDAYDDLSKIQCETLILAGAEDRIVGKTAAQDMADKIPHFKLVSYEGVGHGAYEEEKKFNPKVLDFLLK